MSDGGRASLPSAFLLHRKKKATADILIPVFRIVGGGDDTAADVKPPVLSLWHSEAATSPIHVGF